MYGYKKDIQSIKDWMKRNKVSASALGQASVFRTGAVQRIMSNQCTVGTLDRVLRHIKKYPSVKNPSRAR